MNTAMRPFETTCTAIPEYDQYPSVKELNEHSYDIQQRYPELITIETIGKSQQGRPLILDKINDQGDPEQPRALYVGSVHANELVGGLTAVHTEEEFCADADLRRSLGDCALWMIKTIDPDGYSAQRWRTAGQFTPVAYMSGMLRQAADGQASWGFARLASSEEPIPEVTALAGVIREHKPHFYYSLHNASFGSGYFITTHAYPELEDVLFDEMTAVGLAGRSLGDPSFKPSTGGGFSEYITKPFVAGSHVSDIDFAYTQNTDCMSLVPEMPYFTADMFGDRENGTHTAGAARALHNEITQSEREILEPILRKYESDDSVYARAAASWLKRLANPQLAPVNNRYGGSLVSNAEYAGVLSASLYRVAYSGQVMSAAEQKGDAESVDAIRWLIEARVQAMDAVEPLRPMPIRDMVQVQARAGLLAMHHHFNTLAGKS